MAFVNEKISEIDKPQYDQFQFRSQLTSQEKPLIPAYKWTIDRERDTFLVFLEGQGSEATGSRIPIFFALVWKNKVIRFEGFCELIGKHEGERVCTWKITKLLIPDGFRVEQEIIIGLIKEAMDAFRFMYGKWKEIPTRIDKIAVPIFVKEAL